MLAAYDLPGGALTMAFTGSDAKEVPDGQGGTYIVETFDLDVLEATGRYQSSAGADILHHLADGSFLNTASASSVAPGLSGKISPKGVSHPSPALFFDSLSSPVSRGDVNLLP
jgi:hypothetical protein